MFLAGSCSENFRDPLAARLSLCEIAMLVEPIVQTNCLLEPIFSRTVAFCQLWT